MGKHFHATKELFRVVHYLVCFYTCVSYYEGRDVQGAEDVYPEFC